MTGSPDDNIAARFEVQARATPDAIAIISAKPSTYRELADDMLRTDAFLRARGLRPEEPVAVFMSRSARMVAVLLGILRAGGAYVPLDPADPLERTRQILSQSGASLVFTDSQGLDSAIQELAGEASAVEFINASQIDNSTFPKEPPPPAAGGDRLAYLIFTSGSTGAPKGVAVEHRSVLNLLDSTRELINFTTADRFLAASTIGFDISVAELFLPLTTGGSLLLRDRNIWLAPAQLAADIRQHGVTVLQTGPSTWAVLLDKLPDFPCLRVAISTAEAISPQLACRVAACGEQAWNLYGPTEATIWATAQRLSTEVSPTRNSEISAPIGIPFAGTQVLVLDEDGEPVPDGEVGELYLAGPGLARGYYRNEPLTRERFVVWGPQAVRCYRTGDLVATRDDGSLDYFGRNDDQLKIRGVRLEPREVESAIRDHPDIAEVAATWYHTSDQSRALLAAIVLKTEASLEAAALHDWLVPRLPPQMIPSRFRFLDSLPLSPAGKVDRNALRTAAKSEPITNNNTHLTPTEATLADIWKRLLKLESVTATDHFFSIGGDSLAAVRMVTKAEAKLGVPITVQNVFESPTLAQLATRLDAMLRNEGGAPTDARFVFPLADTAPGRPLFFNAVDLRIAKQGRWRVPCPLYAVSHWIHGAGFLEADTIEELARSQLLAIREIQPTGPYRIAGCSFGGLVALEIAHQLQQAGDEVDFLFLLDPMQPYRTKDNPEPVDESALEPRGRSSRGPQLFRKLFTHPERLPKFLTWHTVRQFERSPLVQWLIYKLVHLHGRKPNTVSTFLLPKNRWPAFWFSAQRRARKYTAKPFPGRVLAVFSEQKERAAVWRDLLADAETHAIAASHSDLFKEPAANEWMETLTRFIEEY
ncbi:MAG: amino acid adenylation domain-containing protein [Verrucomicrobiales bacterium]|jgi:amino acid adenylation domain-containing protein